MKLLSMIAAVLLAAAPAPWARAAAPQSAIPGATAAVMAGAIQFDMASKISGRTYRIFVYRPASPPPPAGYPVVVVTDGNVLFPLTVAAAELHVLRGDKAAMIVGVGYPDDGMMAQLTLRNRDLTPTTPAADAPSGPGMTAANTGGSEAFYDFLTKELRPALAAAYPIDAADQSLYGHSLGGLFTLGVMLRHPEAFRTYLISSPSIWWNHKVVLADEAAFVRRVRAGEVAPRALILVGGEEQDAPKAATPGMWAADAARLVAEAAMVDNGRSLAERLNQAGGRPGYVVRFHAFEDEDHISVMPASIGRALTFALQP